MFVSRLFGCVTVYGQPLFKFQDKRVDFVTLGLGRTPGAQDFQSLAIAKPPVAQHIGRKPVKADRIGQHVVHKLFLCHAFRPN